MTGMRGGQRAALALSSTPLPPPGLLRYTVKTTPTISVLILIQALIIIIIVSLPCFVRQLWLYSSSRLQYLVPAARRLRPLELLSAVASSQWRQREHARCTGGGSVHLAATRPLPDARRSGWSAASRLDDHQDAPRCRHQSLCFFSRPPHNSSTPRPSPRFISILCHLP
ncbi:hypothetical protein EJ05DRAFT_190092 [Pseudovirgaria hyperparasitica]|uniref:Uncharacterized protein n=1 Tax=Pseudovirgaria hyperparasitica TaxID=470096 RepID=A0A6A6WJH5_9PEZI|nr:uncharacterized protein EJ05DRAFT_190092 [Pseudovirgaria hyperparasitica]KAF2761947.1 hypothetical protein EJ05DRAFT_190092 [Pseudovirgaria hyperparasitica]